MHMRYVNNVTLDMIRAYQSNKGDIIVRGVEFVLISLNITAICLEIV